MRKIFLYALFFVLAGTSITSATVSSSTTVEANTVRTAQGDTLCKLSNGNQVPCELVADAEKSIELDGKTINPVTGEVFCNYKDRVVRCDQLDENGNLKITSGKEIFLNTIVFTIKNKVYGILLLLVLLCISGLFIYKKTKNSTPYTAILACIIIAGTLVSQKLVRADVPVYSGVDCRCVTSASQTCVTSPAVDFNWLTIGPGASLVSCDANNNYSTYLWPNTPPQFFYLGIETVIGDIASGNKNEAKGVSTSQNLSATTIGQDTGVSCVRSGGVPNMTLKLTGKLNYTVQGICFIGVCQYYSKISQNYSCY